MMPVASQSEAIAIESPGTSPEPEIGNEPSRAGRAPYLACTRSRDSVLELFQTEPLYSLGRFPLMGPLNLSRARPTGIAYSRSRGLLAVGTRSGAIHLIELVPRVISKEPQSARLAAIRHDTRLR
jgi:hypothetical protein